MQQHYGDLSVPQVCSRLAHLFAMLGASKCSITAYEGQYVAQNRASSLDESIEVSGVLREAEAVVFSMSLDEMQIDSSLPIHPFTKDDLRLLAHFGMDQFAKTQHSPPCTGSWSVQISHFQSSRSRLGTIKQRYDIVVEVCFAPRGGGSLHQMNLLQIEESKQKEEEEEKRRMEEENRRMEEEEEENRRNKLQDMIEEMNTKRLEATWFPDKKGVSICYVGPKAQGKSTWCTMLAMTIENTLNKAGCLMQQTPSSVREPFEDHEDSLGATREQKLQPIAGVSEASHLEIPGGELATIKVDNAFKVGIASACWLLKNYPSTKIPHFSEAEVILVTHLDEYIFGRAANKRELFNNVSCESESQASSVMSQIRAKLPGKRCIMLKTVLLGQKLDAYQTKSIHDSVLNVFEAILKDAAMYYERKKRAKQRTGRLMIIALNLLVLIIAWLAML